MGKSLSIDLRPDSSQLLLEACPAVARQSGSPFSLRAGALGAGCRHGRHSVEAKPQGGDTRSHRIEGFSSVILAALPAQKDVSLVEPADLLRTEHGA